MVNSKNIFSFFRLVSLGILLFVVSCKKEKNNSAFTLDYGYDYFPFEVGRYVIYDVDSVVFNSFTDTIDTYKFQIKEYCESSFLDNEGRTSIRLERYKKNYSNTVPYDSMPWTLVDVWQTNRTVTTAEKVEENIRYVKMTFPAKMGNSWNGNAQNTQEETNYSYADVDVSRTVGSSSFDSTLFVDQLKKENALEKKYYVETYAKHIGMIYKQVIDVRAKTINSKPIMERLDSGLVNYQMTINSYGIN